MEKIGFKPIPAAIAVERIIDLVRHPVLTA